MYWHEFHSAEAPINTSYEFIYGGAQVLVFLHVLARRDRQLN